MSPAASPVAKSEPVAEDVALPKENGMIPADEETVGSDVLEPAAVTRTSAELLHRSPPQVLSTRPVRFVLGPKGVGKSSVAARLLGKDAIVVSGEGLRSALTRAARYKKWPEGWEAAPALLLDEVDCLHGRFGVLQMLGRLLDQRARNNLATVICQGSADTSITLLYESVPLHLRASLLLRFPVGRGRRSYVKARCEARSIDMAHVKKGAALEPWSYAAVESFLDRVQTVPQAAAE
jgi:hypothetical protein